MKQITLKVLAALLCIGVFVLLYYLVIWVLGAFGIVIQGRILQVAFVCLAILAAIYIISGKSDRFIT